MVNHQVTRENDINVEKSQSDTAIPASTLLLMSGEARKKRKIKIDHHDDYGSKVAVSKFMSLFTDDLLLEIFVRLPDCKSIIQCSIVCKGWWYVISYQKYDFIRTRFVDHYQHKQQYLPYTFVFRCHKHLVIPFYQFFSEKSKILHGKSSLYDITYLSFLPWSEVTILGSSKDLLLFSRSQTDYYICNPLTKQWLSLPKAPQNNVTLSGFVCDPKCVNMRYRVVLMGASFSNVENQYKFCATIFCSETGQWNQSTFLLSRREWHRRLVESNGILYWLFGTLKSEGIVAFDPFKSIGHPTQCCLIQFPVGFGRGWRAQAIHVHIGVVQGRLRLSQMFRIKRLGFVLKIWELVNYDYDNDDASWLLVHDVRVTRRKTNQMFVVAFHPINGDVIFLFRDNDIYQYYISEDLNEIVGGFPELQKTAASGSLDVFSLVHPLWPTTIPSLPST